MNLTLDNLLPFLLGRNMISRDSVIFGDYEATSAVRRNSNFQVTTAEEENLLIKVPRAGTHEGEKSSLRELRMYQFVASEKGQVALGMFFPRLVDCDASIPMLAIEFYPKGLPVWRYYKQCGASAFPMQTVARIGELLAKFHGQGRALYMEKPTGLDFLTEELPYPFELHRPALDMLARLSGGSFRLIEVLQSDPLVLEAIGNAISDWEINSLIHGDIKMDNFVLPEVLKELNPSDTEVVLVDWEMVQWGDIAWDVAGAFHDFIFWWIISMPEQASLMEDVSRAAFPIPLMHRAMRVFWGNYQQHSDFLESDFLEKVMRLTCCRMIQTSYEIASKFDFFPRNASLMLNIAMGVLKDPKRGKVELFGFEPEMKPIA